MSPRGFFGLAPSINLVVQSKRTVKHTVAASNYFINGSDAPCTNAIIKESLYPSKIGTTSEAGYTVKKSSDKKIKQLREQLDLPPCSLDRVLVYSEDSELSKKLGKLASVKKAVKKWKDGKIRDKDGNIKNKFVICVNDDVDTKRALNGCTIAGITEQPDGTITAWIWDQWDFNSEYTDKESGSKNLNFPNKIALGLQSSGILNNFQILVPITIGQLDIES